METYHVKIGDTEFDVDRYTKEMMPQLIERIKRGNEKLNAAWAQMKSQANTPEDWEVFMQDWHKQNLRLKQYCDQLQWMGYNECLYMEGKTKTRACCTDNPADLGCRVCPSSVHYWENEIFKEGPDVKSQVSEVPR